jgi:hypothetical protein
VIDFLKNQKLVCNILPSESNTKIIKHSEKFPSAFGGDAILEKHPRIGESMGQG